MDVPQPPLTDQERRFVEAYADCLNATRAARLARYSARSAYEIGSRLLRRPHIRAAVDAELARVHPMPKDEVLHRLAAIARADLSELFALEDVAAPSADPNAKPARRKVLRMDLRQAWEAGALSWVKKVVERKDGSVAVELHDPIAALKLLGQTQGMWAEREPPPPPDALLDRFGAALDRAYAEDEGGGG